jgi:predicted transcriptional regulator
VRGPTPATGAPLARLFALAYRSLVDGLHEGLRTRGWDDVRPAYGFVLLAAREGPTTTTEIAALTGVSKQAASKLLDAMEAAGYLGRVTSAGDARQRPVKLTARGVALLATVEEIYRELEQGWAETLGPGGCGRPRRGAPTPPQPRRFPPRASSRDRPAR